MRLCKGEKCSRKNECLYFKEFINLNPNDSRDFSDIYGESCPHFRLRSAYEFHNLKLLSTQELQHQEELYLNMTKNNEAQHMEILIEDFAFVAEALMKVGYQILSYQDGESNDVVMIDYIHPKFSGRCFVEEKQC